jgi:hypothetical protein
VIQMHRQTLLVAAAMVALGFGVTPTAAAQDGKGSGPEETPKLIDNCRQSAAFFSGDMKTDLGAVATCLGYVMGMADASLHYVEQGAKRPFCLAGKDGRLPSKAQVVKQTYAEMARMQKGSPGQVAALRPYQLTQAALEKAFPCGTTPQK